MMQAEGPSRRGRRTLSLLPSEGFAWLLVWPRRDQFPARIIHATSRRPRDRSPEQDPQGARSWKEASSGRATVTSGGAAWAMRTAGSDPFSTVARIYVNTRLSVGLSALWCHLLSRKAHGKPVQNAFRFEMLCQRKGFTLPGRPRSKLANWNPDGANPNAVCFPPAFRVPLVATVTIGILEGSDRTRNASNSYA